jgi:D-amino-acid dehydrogenase
MRVVVLGGGITGLFTAYYLRKKGHDITIFDRKSETSFTSIYNAGLITPSFAPAPPIGMAKMMRSVLGPSGAMYVSPGEILRNTGWFAKALRTGITRHEKDILELSKLSLSLYKEFFAEEGIHDVDLQQGVLGLYAQESTARAAAEQLSAKFVGPSEIEAKGYVGFGGGVALEQELAINPRKLVGAVTQKLKNDGVVIVDCKQTETARGQGKIDYVFADGRRVNGDAFVVVSGAKCRDLLGPLNYDPRLLPARGMVMLFETDRKDVVGCPALLEDYGIVVVQHNPTTIRLTGFFELNGFEGAFSDARKRWLRETAVQHAPGLKDARLVETGVGFRPCTPDQLPLIGRVPGYSNCFVGTGNCRLGITLAPITGHILSSLISGEQPENPEMLKLVDPARYS